MHTLRLFCTLLLCLAFLPVSLSAQTQQSNAPSPSAAAVVAPIENPKTPEEFFTRARQMSDLEAAGIPFHLKATYVASGDTKFTGKGTFEEWWRSKDVWRKEATLGDYKYVAIKNGDRPTTYATASYTPLRVRQMLNSALIHIDPDEGTSQDWKLERKKLNGVDFSVLTNVNDCGIVRQNLKCYAQGYFTDDGVLRIRVKEVTHELYNDIQPFQGLLIPRSVTLTSDGDTILKISLTTLEPLSPHEIMLSKDAPVPAIPQTSPVKDIRTDSRVTPAILIHRDPLVYPTIAKQRRMEGTVVLKVQIGTDGKILEAVVVHSAGSPLDNAALQSMRSFRFRPATLDGTPVILETTISIDFSLK